MKDTFLLMKKESNLIIQRDLEPHNMTISFKTTKQTPSSWLNTTSKRKLLKHF